MVAILGGTREFIFKAVEQMYTDVATQPGRTFHFPTGRLACLLSDTRENCSTGFRRRRSNRLPASGAHSRHRSSAKATRCSTSAVARGPTR